MDVDAALHYARAEHELALMRIAAAVVLAERVEQQRAELARALDVEPGSIAWPEMLARVGRLRVESAAWIVGRPVERRPAEHPEGRTVTG